MFWLGFSGLLVPMFFWLDLGASVLLTLGLCLVVAVDDGCGYCVFCVGCNLWILRVLLGLGDCLVLVVSCLFVALWFGLIVWWVCFALEWVRACVGMLVV